MANKDQRPTVHLTGGLLTISIGVSALCASIQGGTVFQDFLGGEDATITDEDAFARAIVERLAEEEEDGSTPIHRMFDTAARTAIGDGCEGVCLGKCS